MNAGGSFAQRIFSKITFLILADYSDLEKKDAITTVYHEIIPRYDGRKRADRKTADIWKPNRDKTGRFKRFDIYCKGLNLQIIVTYDDSRIADYNNDKRKIKVKPDMEIKFMR